MCPCCSAVKFQSNCLWGEERCLLVILSGENGLVFQLCPCSIPVSPLCRVSFFCSDFSLSVFLVLSSHRSLSLSGELVAWPWHTLRSVSLINHTVTEYQTGGAACYFLFLNVSKLSFSPSYLFLMPVAGQGWHRRRQWGTDFFSDLSWSVQPYKEEHMLNSTFLICIHYQSLLHTLLKKFGIIKIFRS